jgi:hypothetical protein
MTDSLRKNLINQLFSNAIGKIESWDQKNDHKGAGSSGKGTINRTTHSKNMHTSVTIRS